MVSDEARAEFNKRYRKDIAALKQAEELNSSFNQDIDDAENDPTMEQMEELWRADYKDALHVVITSKQFWIAQVIAFVAFALLGAFITYHFLVH